MPEEKRYGVRETKVFSREERTSTEWPLPPLTLEEARQRVWVRREWHRHTGATWEMVLEIVDRETGAVMPEQEERTFRVRTRWEGWMKGTQELEWPPDSVSLENARKLAQLCRTHSPIALATYEVVDVRTGETVPEET